jgi:hypothetical protein
MASSKSKKITEDIDESFLLQSIKERGDEPKEKVKPAPQPEIKETPEIRETPQIEPEPVPVSESESVSEPVSVSATVPVSEKPKETTRRKRIQADYSSIFLQKNELKERSCVYISRRIHSTITEIVRCIADRDVTVGGYIDSVLLQHLETHRDEINNLYKRERKDLIEF